MPNGISIEIPSPIENLQLPEPNLTMWWQNALNHRTFWIDFDIDIDLLSIERMILDINRQDAGKEPEQRKPIVIWIYSYGGDLDCTLSFIDVCELSKTPIITINAGVSMSGGLMALLAGHKRYALKRSRALIHSGSASGIGGTYEQNEAVMADYKRQIQTMRSYIVSRTGMDEKLYKKKQSAEWYLSAEEQLANGIVHGILTDLSAVEGIG